MKLNKSLMALAAALALSCCCFGRVCLIARANMDAGERWGGMRPTPQGPQGPPSLGP